MGDDGAGNPGAVPIDRFAGDDGVERIRDHAGQFGMGRVDAGIDHRDQDIVALGERMRLRQLQLGQRILRGITHGGRRGLRRLLL